MKHGQVFLLMFFVTLFSCGKDQIRFHRSYTTGVDEIDNLGRHPERHIFVLGFVRRDALNISRMIWQL